MLEMTGFIETSPSTQIKPFEIKEHLNEAGKLNKNYLLLWKILLTYLTSRIINKNSGGKTHGKCEHNFDNGRGALWGIDDWKKHGIQTFDILRD